MPVVEWATWWDQTLARWYEEGLPRQLTGDSVNDYFQHDRLHQFWLPVRDEGCPAPAYHGAPLASTPAEYARLRKHLLTEELLDRAEAEIATYVRLHGEEEAATWFTLEGFFWFPRTIFGIEGHLYAFYDQPELMEEINRALCDYHKRLLARIYAYVTPQFMTFAEDMSYNHGPMLSKDCYDEFIKPYYREIIPFIKSKGTKVFIDTDGDVEPLIPWFQEAGIEGVLPLERQAGVDVNRIRRNYPEWLMIGGYDKTIMHLGEESMRAEFERLLPAMKSGRYIPSVDHQTPPDVTLDNYKIYVSLLKEYAQKAMQD